MLQSEPDSDEIPLTDYMMPVDEERQSLIAQESGFTQHTLSDNSDQEIADVNGDDHDYAGHDADQSTNTHIHSKASKARPCFVYILSFFSAIGGFLFGYDTGVVSGAMLLLKDKFSLSSVMQEVIVSVTIGFAFLFALVGGIANDKLGRKLTTICASIVFAIGAVLLAAAEDVSMLVIGRAILGMGIGLASMTVPVYIAECAPPELRGRLVTLNTLFITGGQFVASCIDGAFSYDRENGWRYMFGLAAVPAIIQFVGFFFLPESPRWLVARGRLGDAREVLTSIRGTGNVDEELEAVRESVEEDRREREIAGSNVFLKIMRTPAVRRALFVGCGLQLFQQLSGINTVMYYSATIIKMSGVRDDSEAIWLAAVTAFINFAFTAVALFLVDRIGRRKLILASLSGVLLSLVVLAVGFQLAAVNSPPVTVKEDVNSTCNTYSWCESCIENSDCGYCYSEAGSKAVNGSCLPVDSDHKYSIGGRCNTTSSHGDMIYAVDYCPTSYTWIGVLGLGLYLMCFAPGMGPMPWTINSEIYPLWARSTGNSLATATNWLSNLLVSMTFLTLTESITKYGTYWLFVGIVICGLVFMSATLPETKGRRLEEVEELFSQPLCSCGRASSDGYHRERL